MEQDERIELSDSNLQEVNGGNSNTVDGIAAATLGLGAVSAAAATYVAYHKMKLAKTQQFTPLSSEDGRVFIPR